MGKKNISEKAWKIFGFLYFILHGIILMALSVLIAFAVSKAPEMWSSFVLLIFPLLGIFAGLWIHRGHYNVWRVILIVFSLLSFTAFLFFAVIVGPELKDLETLQQQHAQQDTTTLDASTEQFFLGVYSSDISMIKEYLDQGFNANVINETGHTALHIAQNKEIIELLIKSGADVNALDQDHMTPIFNKEIYLTKILVEAGADVNAKSTKGNTPLMWYCYSGYHEGVKYMVSLGSDVNTINIDGQTAYDIAEHFSPGLLDYLESIGAKQGL